jgi:TIR domain-containing protein
LNPYGWHRAKKAMADIFISYAGENRETTKTLAQMLADQGWSVWWDRHIPSGRRFHDVIERELTAARCVIALWSTAALHSPWVREEAQEGLDRNILVSARIETVRLPIGFRTVQTTDLSDWKGKPAHPGFMQLVEDIRAVLGEASPETPVSGPEAKRWRPYLALLALLGVLAAVGLGYALVELRDYEWRRPTPVSVSKPPDEAVPKPADQPVPQPPDKPVAPPSSATPPEKGVSPTYPEADKPREEPAQTQPGERAPESAPKRPPLPIAPTGPTVKKPVQQQLPKTSPERDKASLTCGDILHRLQLGEVLSDEDWRYLKECR